MLSSSDTESRAKVRNVFICLHRDFGSNILFGFENSSAKNMQVGYSATTLREN